MKTTNFRFDDAIMAIIARVEALIIVVTLGLHDIIQRLFFRPFPPRGENYISVDAPAVKGKVAADAFLAWANRELDRRQMEASHVMEWSRDPKFVNAFNTIKVSSIHIGGAMATVRAESPEDAIDTLLHTLDK